MISSHLPNLATIGSKMVLQPLFQKVVRQIANFLASPGKEGPSITNWIMLCYQNIESWVLNNVWASNFFALERGVRQGCPFFPCIFLLCVEILAERIRTNKDIEGIFIKGNEIKISRYAYDTTLILNGSEKSLTGALHVELFSTLYSLKLNNKTTEVL